MKSSELSNYSKVKALEAIKNGWSCNEGGDIFCPDCETVKLAIGEEKGQKVCRTR